MSVLQSISWVSLTGLALCVLVFLALDPKRRVARGRAMLTACSRISERWLGKAVHALHVYESWLYGTVFTAGGLTTVLTCIYRPGQTWQAVTLMVVCFLLFHIGTPHGGLEAKIRWIFQFLPWEIGDYLQDNGRVLNLKPLGETLTDAALIKHAQGKKDLLRTVYEVHIESSRITARGLKQFLASTLPAVDAVTVWNSRVDTEELWKYSWPRRITVSINGYPEFMMHI